ncbi:uncharacterized protein [Procambarus clarkii]|uniref:uncharacterized protein n=1 Tax=Procambarus clarkii TaxID=6728 RepID=UPI001E678ABD|nr:uncharacterized protein LOC123754505 [Procambarus clarkii]
MVMMAAVRPLLADGCGTAYVTRALASTFNPAVSPSMILFHSSSGGTREGHVTCRHLCSSSKPPELQSGSCAANDKDKHKESESTDNPVITNADRLLTRIREKKPQIYSLRQQLSEKSSSMINNMRQTSMSKFTGGADTKKPEDWNDILNRWYQQYQDFIGITDLKNAQDRVTELSEVLHEVQSKRRELQAEIEDIQDKLVVNHERITKTEQYSQEHFTLFDQAREMNARLKTLRTEFVVCERHERDTFTQMSAAIRDCHERERMQAEQSKYWSIIASVISAALASLITSVNNWVRIREIKDHVSGNGQNLLDGFQQMHKDVLGTITTSLTSPTRLQPELVMLADNAEAQFSSKATQQTENSSVQSNIGICESSDRLVPANVTKDDVTKLTADMRHTVLQHINETFVKEKELLIEQLNKELNIIISSIVSEGSKAQGEIASMVKKSLLEAGAAQHVEHQEAAVVVKNYSYGRIATAMAVGAGIGTLATAFVFKALGGSGL